MRCSSLNTTRPVRPSTSRYLYAPQATTLPHSTPPPVFIFHNFYLLSQISTEYLWVPIVPLGCDTSQYPCISGYHVYFLVPWISLGTSCCLTHALVPLGTFGLWYLSVPLYLRVPCVFLGALDILRYFFLPYTRLGTFRYIRVVIPLSTPVSLGTMFISWCLGYPWVLLVALHTPWYL